MLGGYDSAEDYLIREVHRKVQARSVAFTGRRAKWRQHQALYDLTPFGGETEEDIRKIQGDWRRHTTADPQTYAKKISEFIAGSRVMITCSTPRELREKRIVNQTTVDFLEMAFREADKSLVKRLQPELLEQFGYYLPVRGWVAGRCLLRRGTYGETIVDITPWDPANVIWEMGHDGLAWACNMSYQRLADVKANHPDIRQLTPEEMDDQSMILVYDYYDRWTNVVFAENFEIKKQTLHGMVDEVPVFIAASGGRPIAAYSGMRAYGQLGTGFLGNLGGGAVNILPTGDQLSDVGESCFEGAVALYQEFNYIMSVMKNILARSGNNSVLYYSPGGQDNLPANPNKEGVEITADIRSRIEVLDLPQMAKETDLYLGELRSQLQRATLPYTVYGSLEFQLSGFAITQLEQSLNHRVMPFIRGAKKAMVQIALKLLKQYSSGFFMPISIESKYDMFAPMMIQQADPIAVKVKADLPRDLAGRMAVAQQARAGDFPLLPDSIIRRNLLDEDYEEDMEDLINAQEAERRLPAAMFQTLFESLIERGEDQKAMEYLIQYEMDVLQRRAQYQMLQMQVAMMGMNIQQMGMPGQGGDNGSGGGASGGSGGAGISGVSPSQMPQAMMGQPPPSPFMQSGPLVPAGAARPGARTDHGQSIASGGF